MANTLDTESLARLIQECHEARPVGRPGRQAQGHVYCYGSGKGRRKRRGEPGTVMRSLGYDPYTEWQSKSQGEKPGKVHQLDDMRTDHMCNTLLLIFNSTAPQSMRIEGSTTKFRQQRRDHFHTSIMAMLWKLYSHERVDQITLLLFKRISDMRMFIVGHPGKWVYDVSTVREKLDELIGLLMIKFEEGMNAQRAAAPGVKMKRRRAIEL